MVVIEGLDNFNLTVVKAQLVHAFTETVQTGAMTVEFQITDRSQDLGIFVDALAEQLGGDASAAAVVLPDEAQALAAGQIGVKGDGGDTLGGQLIDLSLDGNVGNRTDRNALRTVSDQLVDSLDDLARNVGLTLPYHHIDVKVSQFGTCGLDTARDLGFKMVIGPVGQDDTQTDGREMRFGQRALVCIAWGDIPKLLHGSQNAGAHLGFDIRAIVQYTVNRAARNTGALGDHLDGGTFSHAGSLPFIFGKRTAKRRA